jgi:aspartate ammonia-lyase
MTRKSKYDLDVDYPYKVSQVLQRVAERYYKDAAEMVPYEPDGKTWAKIAGILENAAYKIEHMPRREWDFYKKKGYSERLGLR